MTGERIDKTERLLNLTLALLATRRPMRKSEIFSNIPGYSGNPDSMERMFERDKDELREMGIIVRVLPIDAFFDDEFGYQILASEFFLPDITLSQEESVWLAIATAFLKDSSTSLGAESAFQKLMSSNEIPVDEVIASSRSWNLDVSLGNSLTMLWRAIKEKSSIQCDYTSRSTTTQRIVSPYTLTSRYGTWYLIAQDDNDHKIKSFRVDRMLNLKMNSQNNFTDLPKNFDLSSFLKSFHGEQISELTLKVHKALSSMHPLVEKSSFSISDGYVPVGSLLIYQNIDRQEAFNLILWAGDSVEVIAPDDVRHEIIENLNHVVRANS